MVDYIDFGDFGWLTTSIFKKLNADYIDFDDVGGFGWLTTSILVTLDD